MSAHAPPPNTPTKYAPVESSARQVVGTEDDTDDCPAVGLLRLNALPERKPLFEDPPHVRYGDESVCDAFRARVGWLGLFLIGLWSAAFIIDAFEHTLQANVELAHFVPLIIGQGGNAGSQAVSSVIRALAGKEIDVHSRPAGWVVAKESVVGALCGLVLGVFVLVVGVCCRIVSFNVGVVVCISLPLVSLWANFLGAILPLLAARLRRNPAVTSAPLMTTIIDSSGLLIYFYVAAFYLQLQGHQVDHHHTPHHRAHRHGPPGMGVGEGGVGEAIFGGEGWGVGAPGGGDGIQGFHQALPPALPPSAWR
mmetsp:Transcript_65757/g.158555  ORF Transcript_65757/g.158555 Transcript_65757/m.158555 type:complete len:309 (+) Transcript_65757:82-1008(+)